jgi:glycosyltransferase involved in cell wall biosynthesis
MRRRRALLATPLPPLETGLATYAIRVLEGTCDLIDWTVAFAPGSDPGNLPAGVASIPIAELDEPARIRIFQLGNSPHCFDVLYALYRFGGAGLFHEVHLHHMIRHCCLERGLLPDYSRELRFEYGPSAERVSRLLSIQPSDEAEYDARLKRYPLTARAVHACSSLVCLNGYAASILRNRGKPVTTIHHPLSPLPERLETMEKPGDPVIGMAGGFHYGRNLESVIEAVGILRRSRPDAVLLLAGGGYPDGLPDWAIRAPRRLPEREYQQWIRAMDVAVDIRHPPLGETSGSLLEVMRAGVPAVVSASGAFNTLPSDSVLRVPVDNLVHGTAASLELPLSRDDLRHSMSETSKAWALEQGSTETLRRDWIALIEERALQIDSTPGDRTLNRRSLSPAWHDVPPGFEMDISGKAVAWSFEGTATLEGPPGTRGAWVTARGHGELSGKTLSETAAVYVTEGSSIIFSGRGEVTNIHWLSGEM